MTNELIIDVSANESVERELTQDEVDALEVVNLAQAQEREATEAKRRRMDELEAEDAQMKLDLADIQLALAELFTA